MGDALRDPAGVPPRIFIPLGGHEQSPVDRTGGLRGGGGDRDADLAVADLAQGAAVLAGDADRFVAELGEAGVVDHPGIGTDLDVHPQRQVPAHRLGPPRRLVDELLQALLVAVLQAVRHRLDRLALAVEHQPPQVDLSPAALIIARHRLEHLLCELDQAAADPLQLCGAQPRHLSHSRLLRRCHRGGVRPLTAKFLQDLTDDRSAPIGKALSRPARSQI